MMAFQLRKLLFMMIHLWKTFHFDTALLSAANEGPDTDLYMVDVTTHTEHKRPKLDLVFEFL